MDNNYDIVNGANPSILWTQYMDFLSLYAKQMKSIYTKHIRHNQPISWSELDEVNDFVHKQLDYIITWSEKFKPEINQDEINETNFMKQKIRLTESQLNRVIRRCINNIINEDFIPSSKLDKYKYEGDVIDYPAYYDLLQARYQLDELYRIYDNNPLGNPLTQEKILRLQKLVEKLENQMMDYTPAYEDTNNETDYTDVFYDEFSDVPGVKDEE